MRPDDTLVVWKLDRLARSLRQLLDTVEALHARQIGLRSLTEAIDTRARAGALVKRGQFKLPAFGTLGTFGACHVPGPLQTDGLPLCSLTQSLASDMCPSTPRS